MNEDAFQPHTGVQTSVLVVQKKTEDEKLKDMESKEAISYDIFMSIIERVGHDKRGNTIYKRDQYGNELLEDIEELVPQEDGSTRKEIRKEKIIDDQSKLVAPTFNEWKSKQGIFW